MCSTCRSHTSSKLSYFVYVLFWNSVIGDVADFVWCSTSESHTQTPNCLYLWWSLCTLCLLLDVLLVEFMYLVFTRMPDESYRRRLRSLLSYLRYVFRALVTSLLCWFQTVLFFLLSASCFGTQVTAVVAARAIFYEWATHKFQTVVFFLLFWNSVIGDICCPYDVLRVGHIHTSSKLSSSSSVCLSLRRFHWCDGTNDTPPSKLALYQCLNGLLCTKSWLYACLRHKVWHSIAF